MSDSCRSGQSSCCCSGNSCSVDSSCCCAQTEPWVTGSVDTPAGSVPIISTTLTRTDMFGAWKVRWGIGRMNYTIDSGLYAVGEPKADSPVLVSANYKLTFDTLRKELSGLDCWLLILDTKGVNVWCAAGKGTFGTDELVRQIEKTGLGAIVSHKRLILPQLGASGIDGTQVSRRTGFAVAFGPVRAGDIKQYLSSGNNASEEMRTVNFTAWDRLKLTPIEIVTAARQAVPAFAALFLLNLFAARPFELNTFIIYLGSALMGTFATPLLLPYIPVKMFAFKGGILGLLWGFAASAFFGFYSRAALLALFGYILISMSISAWYAMNFTGSSTYTSPSGVMKEMKIALPFISGAAAVGGVLLVLFHIFGL